MPVDLEHELDELYGADLADFVSVRDELAKRLRSEGEKDEADHVKRLRKPTVSAWTVNRLAREERRDFDLLLDAGHRLREAQAGLLQGGDPEELDRARAAQRDALRTLTTAVRRILAERGAGAQDGTLDRVVSTLRAASVSESGRELLARGRLSEDVEPAGFEALGSLGDLGPTAPAPRSAPRRDPRVQLRELRSALADARREQGRREDEARAAAREVERLRRELERAERDATRAQAEAEAAASAAAEAQERLDSARRTER